MTLQDQHSLENDNQTVITARMRQRLTSIAAAGIVCTLLGWIFSPLNSTAGNAENGTANSIPAMSDSVFRTGSAHYHWNQKCPLANYRSQRIGEKGRTRPRVFMSRRDAEKQTLYPCSFCREGS